MAQILHNNTISRCSELRNKPINIFCSRSLWFAVALALPAVGSAETFKCKSDNSTVSIEQSSDPGQFVFKKFGSVKTPSDAADIVIHGGVMETLDTAKGQVKDYKFKKNGTEYEFFSKADGAVGELDVSTDGKVTFSDEDCSSIIPSNTASSEVSGSAQQSEHGSDTDNGGAGAGKGGGSSLASAMTAALIFAVFITFVGWRFYSHVQFKEFSLKQGETIVVKGAARVKGKGAVMAIMTSSRVVFLKGSFFFSSALIPLGLTSNRIALQFDKNDVKSLRKKKGIMSDYVFEKEDGQIITVVFNDPKKWESFLNV